jgi:hypothetical protein
MKRTPFYRWYITDPETGARHLTSWRMCAEDVAERHPGAEPDLSSLEWRDLPESMDEWDVARRG